MKYVGRMKNENWSLEAKNGLPELFIEGNLKFYYELEYAGVKNVKYYRKKLPKMTKNIFIFFSKNCKRYPSCQIGSKIIV